VPERVLLVFAVVALVALVILVVRYASARRVAAVRRLPADWGALGVRPDSRRTVVAFSTPSCSACHVAQSPAIERARAELANANIRRIDVDAARHPEVARAFGILTVPSTVVIAAGGAHVIAVNQGFTPSARLVEQLQLAEPRAIQ
jgi:thiol-disulfide isomerase/thioredoxin